MSEELCFGQRSRKICDGGRTAGFGNSLKERIDAFGSNGGEEFLSHLNIGEALVLEGGEDWAKWDKSMTENMNRIQNKDGSWTGHHCITGRTFCTSAALLVLMVDRAPSHLGTVIKKR